MHSLTTSELITTCAVIAVATCILTIVTMVAIKQNRLHRDKVKPVDIAIHPEDRVLIWQTIYQQTSESLRDQAKLLASSNFAALAGGVALYNSASATKFNEAFLAASLVIFGVGLVWSLAPIAGIAEKMRDDIAEIMRHMDGTGDQKITLHHPWPTGPRGWASLIAMTLLAVGIFLFVLAITTKNF